MSSLALVRDPEPIVFDRLDLSRVDRVRLDLNPDPSRPSAERVAVEVFSLTTWATGTVKVLKDLVGTDAELGTAVSIAAPAAVANPAARVIIDDLEGVERLAIQTGTTAAGESVRIVVSIYRPE